MQTELASSVHLMLTVITSPGGSKKRPKMLYCFAGPGCSDPPPTRRTWRPAAFMLALPQNLPPVKTKQWRLSCAIASLCHSIWWKNNNAASHSHRRRQAWAPRLAVLGHMTRNWLQFRPVVRQFSLPRSPYASNITNIHNYYIAAASTPLRSGAYMLVRFFISFYFFEKPYCGVCVRGVRVYVFCFVFYFIISGKGLFGGLAV